MPESLDALSRIPFIGAITSILGGGGSGPRTRQGLPPFRFPDPHETFHVETPPPIPQIGTTTPDSTTGSIPDTTSTTSTPTTTGETDRERRRRERAEERARLNRRTNVSILSSLQTGLGIFSQISTLARQRTTPGIVGAAMAFPPAPLGAVNNVLRASVGQLQPLPAPGSGRTVGGFGGGPATRLSNGNGALMGPPAGYHWAKDGSGRIVRNRTMNVLNLSAAKRAIRRIKGARKVLRSIESSLPKRASSASKRKR